MHRRSFVLLVVIAIGLAGCTGTFDSQTINGFTVELTGEPNPSKVGENLFRVRITEDDGRPLAGAKVDLPYFMIYEKFPSEAEHYVRVAEATEIREGSYEGRIPLEKPGTWKISVRIRHDKKPPFVATFTITLKSS